MVLVAPPEPIERARAESLVVVELEPGESIEAALVEAPDFAPIEGADEPPAGVP